MHVVIFGNGPIPTEKSASVTAPGARTWQITRTVAAAMAKVSPGPHLISLIALDERAEAKSFSVQIPVQHSNVSLRYMPLAYEQYKTTGASGDGLNLEPRVQAVVGCASVQPYATAASFSHTHNLPLWIDVFGDPLSEWQTRAATIDNREAAENQQVHVWKLFLDGLLAGDRFSTLSLRQRYALLGQLGCAGRLNQYTVSDQLVRTIPYGVFSDELPALENKTPSLGTFNLLWCGSFNTWMDVDTLSTGVLDAMKQNPQIRLTVVGGQVPGYSETAYGRFVAAIRDSDLTGSVQLLDWQPVGRMAELYRNQNLGISIDRFSYEAYLGSRTRIVNFMAHGVPVASTAISELTEELAAAELLLPFEIGNSQDLTRVLVEAASQPETLAEMAIPCQQFVAARYDALRIGQPLIEWIIEDRPLAGDHKIDESTNAKCKLENELSSTWEKVRQPLGL